MKRLLHGRSFVILALVMVLALGSRASGRRQPIGDGGTWTTVLPGTPAGSPLPAVCDNRGGGTGLCFAAVGTALSAVDANSGAVKWHIDLATATIEGITTARDRFGTEIVVLTSSDGFVYRYNGDGTLVWRSDTKRGGCPSDTLASAPVVQEYAASNSTFQQTQTDGLVLAATAYTENTGTACDTISRNKVFALRLADGSVAWTFNPLGVDQMGPALASCALGLHDNSLICATAGTAGFQNTLFAMDTTSGSRRWAASLGELHSSPAVDERAHRVYAASFGSLTAPPQLFAIDAATGLTAWQVDLAATNASATAVFARPGRSNRVFVNASGALFAFDDNGSSARTVAGSPVTLGAAITGTPLVHAGAGMIFVNAGNGATREIDALSLEQMRVWTLGNGEPSLSPTFDAATPFGKASYIVTSATSDFASVVIGRSGITWPVGDPGGPFPPDDSASHYAADIGLSVEGPSAAQVGATQTTIFTVENNGPDVATDARIAIAIPTSGFQVQSIAASQGWTATSADATTVGAMLGDLNAGDSATVTLTWTVNRGGVYSTAGSISAAERDSNSTNDFASLATTATLASPGAPALSSGVTPNGTGVFGLTWTPVAGTGVRYTLQHQDGTGAGYVNVATGLLSSSFAFMPGSAEREGSWTYRVIAIAGGSAGPPSPPSSAIVVDETAPNPPIATADRAPDFATGAWYRDGVTVTFGANGDVPLADGTPGTGVASVTSPIGFAKSGTFIAAGTAVDAVGNVSAPASLTVNVDADLPSIAVSCVTQTLLHAPAVLFFTASDPSSGLASPASGTAPLDTSAVGNKSGSSTAIDNVGHTASQSCSYLVTYRFLGFSSPASGSTWKARHTVPMRFSIGDANGVRIPDADAAVVAAACGARLTFTGGTPTSNCFGYDAKAHQFSFDLSLARALAPGGYTVTATITNSPGTVVGQGSVGIIVKH